MTPTNSIIIIFLLIIFIVCIYVLITTEIKFAKNCDGIVFKKNRKDN